MTPLHTKEEKLLALSEFLDVLDTLREQCPWDAKQTNQSLRPNTIEEVFELADALIAEDNYNIRKELGDVLLHVAFYSRIGEEKGEFDIADVCNSLVEKLKFRHPHIYGDVNVDSADEVVRNWEQIKLKEKNQTNFRSNFPDSSLIGIIEITSFKIPGSSTTVFEPSICGIHEARLNSSVFWSSNPTKIMSLSGMCWN